MTKEDLLKLRKKLLILGLAGVMVGTHKKIRNEEKVIIHSKMALWPFLFCK